MSWKIDLSYRFLDNIGGIVFIRTKGYRIYYYVFIYKYKDQGAIVVVTVLELDLQPMQSVPITTNVVSSNIAQAGCTRFNIM